MGRTVNPLSFDFSGSNPLLPTRSANPGFSGNAEEFFEMWFMFTAQSPYIAACITCGSSSVGRATAFQAVGRGFEPRLPLKTRL
jgi:hypothetical protein